MRLDKNETADKSGWDGDPSSNLAAGTRAHVEKIESNLTGKREHPDEMSCWTGHNIKHDDRAEAMTGPFKWGLVHASKEHAFSISVSCTLNTQEIITALKLCVETEHH